MLYRIKRFGIGQTSRMAGVVYFFVGTLIAPFLFMGSFSSQLAGGGAANGLSPLSAFFVPFLYGLIGYAMTALILYIYNLAAQRMGGIELDIVYAAAPPAGHEDAAADHGAAATPSA